MTLKPDEHEPLCPICGREWDTWMRCNYGGCHDGRLLKPKLQPIRSDDEEMRLMNSCPRFGKFVGGCLFEARYDKGEPKLTHDFSYTGSSGAARLEQFRQSTYIRDICVRCGKAIERAALAATKREASK